MGYLTGVERFILFVSTFLLVGGSAFIATLWPGGADRRGVRRVLWWSSGALLVATLLGLGLHGADVGGLGVADALKPSVLNSTLDTSFGKAGLARILLLVPIAVLLELLPSARRFWWRAIGAALGVGVLLTLVLSGHAATGRWLPLTRAADLLHLAASSVWLGGLALLLSVVLRGDVTEARAVTKRFSAVAFGAVAVVVVSGTFQSFRQLETLDQLETPYGRLLVLKVVLVLLLIGVSSLTRSAVRQDDGDDEVGVLRRLVGVEAAVAVLVLAATALLMNASPGDVSTAAGPFDETHAVDDTLINVVVEPGVVGPTDIHLYVDDPGGGLAAPLNAKATFSLAAAGFESIDVPFIDAGPSHWSAKDIDLPLAGEWVLTVEVSLTDVDTVSTSFTVPIGGSP